MKLGILAYSSDTGLGNQSWEVYKHLNPEKVLLIDLSKLNGMPTHHERYLDARVTDGIPNEEDCQWITDGVDYIFECETPLNYRIHELAKQKGVKVVQQFNPEFLDYWRKPNLTPPFMLANPSSWLIDEVQKLNLAKTTILRVPINRGKLQFRKIESCNTFFHIIGRPTAGDRNGTLQYLDALKAFPKQRHIVYLQPPSDRRAIEYFAPVKEALNRSSAIVITNVEKYEDLYKQGDVLVLPRKYGGLCLPMQEALSCGIPVVMTDISPNRDLLPEEWLCNAEYERTFYAHRNIDCFRAKSDSLIETMRKFLNDDFMKEANQKADEIAEGLSWERLKPTYLDLMK